MGANSKIEWTDHTFNPWRGCTKVAAGCANCYAARDAKRFPDKLGIWGDEGTRVVAAESTWKQPKTWNDAAAKAGVRARVFCASLADVFEDWCLPIVDSKGNQLFLGLDLQIRNEPVGRQANLQHVRTRLFNLIDATPHLDWLLLTKRPENIRRMWPEIGPCWAKTRNVCERRDRVICPEDSCDREDGIVQRRHNVWLGTSIATQADADQNIPELLKCRDLAPVLFASAEPLLEEIDLEERSFIPTEYCSPSNPPATLNWLIAGGESGPGARACNVEWLRSLRDQCFLADVPVFIKQLGSNAWIDPSELERLRAEPGYKPLQEAKGGDIEEWPADLRIREIPEVNR